jgi:chorismate mutase
MPRRGSRGRKEALKTNDRRSGAPPGDPMDDLRHRIDAIDRRIVGLLNERADCAIALGRIKKERALPIYQPAREEEVLGNVQRTNGGPLQSAALRRLFERIIDESRRIERIATDRGGEPAAGGASPVPADPGDPQD